MKELNIGDQIVRVRATPLALIFYNQEFNSDLIGDLVKFRDISEDLSKLDTVAILKLIWAMAKADSFGKSFPSFEGWVATLEFIDFSDSQFLAAAMEEAQNGFFRKSGVKGAIK
ncbi:hypothetical protein [Paenibacillus illinoisensis]|uniref:hypothetical protein n=1 Tax=Paenibacillus illinoisensis TaxID=59845 RepID=UPI002041C98D|nr:hypothetical protein [Paenibacillus illinoisensis]MCM3208489.1 hypothetical protein [Paenibacillus illinoisensis]